MSKSASEPDIFTQTFSTAEVAEVLRVSPTHVGTLVRDGWIPRQNNGEFLLADAIGGYMKSRLEAGQAERHERDARLGQLKIAERSVALADKRGQLMNLGAAMVYIGEQIEPLFRAFDGVPAKLYRDPKQRSQMAAMLSTIEADWKADHAKETARIEAAIDGGASTPE